MTGCARGCVGLTGTVVILLGVAWAGWRWGGEVFPRIERFVGANTEMAAEPATGASPSRAVAEDALARFNRFRAAGDPATLALDELELTSIVRYSLPGAIPAGVQNPTVEVQGDRLILSARVAVSAFPEMPALDDVRGLLPDTVRIRMTASLLPFDDGHAALVVDGVEASGVPLPARMIPGILNVLGRTPRPGLPETALAVPLPRGIRQAYAADGALIFVAEE